MDTKIRLYEIPEESKIFGECSDGSTFLTFKHLDGLYSYCITEKGGVINLSGGTPLKVTEGGYIISTQ
jgi:hypothetical protein